MANLNDIVQEIADNRNRSFDVPFKLRLENLVVQGYSAAITQEGNRRGNLPNFLYKEIRELEIEKVSESKKKITSKRSKLILPTPLRYGRNGLAIRYLGSVNRSIPYTHASHDRFKFISEGSRFKKGRYYDWIDDRVYFHDTDDKFFTIQYIPSNPIAFQNFINEQNLSCTDLFNYPEYLIRPIKAFVYEELGIDISEDKEIILNKDESN